MNQDHPWVAVNTIIRDGDKILLMQRSETDSTFPDYWALVGGFMEWGEKVEETIVREVKEEIGVDVEIEKFSGRVYNTPHPSRGIVISIPFYTTIVNGTPHPAQVEECKDVKWFLPEEIRKMELAFDHKQILQDEKLI